MIKTLVKYLIPLLASGCATNPSNTTGLEERFKPDIEFDFFRDSTARNMFNQGYSIKASSKGHDFFEIKIYELYKLSSRINPQALSVIQVSKKTRQVTLDFNPSSEVYATKGRFVITPRRFGNDDITDDCVNVKFYEDRRGWYAVYGIE